MRVGFGVGAVAALGVLLAELSPVLGRDDIFELGLVMPVAVEVLGLMLELRERLGRFGDPERLSARLLSARLPARLLPLLLGGEDRSP